MAIESIPVEPSVAGNAVPVATDRIGGVDYQIVKLAIGADGAATLIDSAGMPVSATSLPLPSGASTEATLALAKGVLDAILTASQAIQTAAAALNSKTTVVNTGAVAGTVALDAPSLAALENVTATIANFPGTQPVSGTVALDAPSLAALESVTASISNWPGTQPVSGTFWQATQPVSGPLTDAQLRAGAVPVSGTFYQGTQPVSAAALPLPTGASTEATLSAVNGKLPALSGGRIPVELPAGGGGLTDAELRATPVPVSGSFAATANTEIDDLFLAVQVMLERIENPIMMDQTTGRMRVMLDPIGGAQTLGTVTTVGTVTTCSTVTTVATLTNQAQIGGVKADSMVYDSMHNAWATSVLGAIT